MAISAKRRRAILAANGGACHYCGSAAEHVDHIIAQTAGGTGDLGNLIAACVICNMGKRCDRLPPGAESRALARVEELRPAVLALEQSQSRQPTPVRSARITINLTPAEMEMVDSERAAARVRSLSAFCRGLILEALLARKDPAARGSRVGGTR